MKTYLVQLDDDEVLVALRRGQGYEDVHPELIAEDAIEDSWPEYRTVVPEEIKDVLKDAKQ